MKKLIASIMLSAVAIPGLFAAANNQPTNTTQKTATKKTHKKHSKSTTAKSTTTPAPAAN